MRNELRVGSGNRIDAASRLLNGAIGQVRVAAFRSRTTGSDGLGLTD